MAAGGADPTAGCVALGAAGPALESVSRIRSRPGLVIPRRWQGMAHARRRKRISVGALPVRSTEPTAHMRRPDPNRRLEIRGHAHRQPGQAVARAILARIKARNCSGRFLLDGGNAPISPCTGKGQAARASLTKASASTRQPPAFLRLFAGVTWYDTPPPPPGRGRCRAHRPAAPKSSPALAGRAFGWRPTSRPAGPRLVVLHGPIRMQLDPVIARLEIGQRPCASCTRFSP